MDQLIHCPSCDCTLKVSDSQLGGSVRCGRCATVFTASKSAPSDAAKDERPDVPTLNRADDFDDRRERRPRRRRWEDEDDDDDYGRWDDRPIRRRSLDAIRAKVAPPAIVLMIYGVLLILGGVICLVPVGYSVWQLTAPPRPLSQADKDDAIAMAVICSICAILALAVGPVIVWGGMRMKQLRSYGLAMAVTIMSGVIGFLFCILLVALSIWPLVVLLDSDVRAAFNRPRE